MRSDSMLYRTPFLLPDENQMSSSEPLPDSCENLITRNGIDTSGPEFGKPTLTILADTVL
jgi:hypothetical protein